MTCLSLLCTVSVMTQPSVWTVAELADRLSVSRKTLERMIEADEVSVIRRDPIIISSEEADRLAEAAAGQLRERLARLGVATAEAVAS